MPTPVKPVPTEEEILARFHRIRITIGMSATKFGYVTTGQPGLVRRLTEGCKMRVKGRRRCGEVLDEIEREHSIPLPEGGEQNENKPVDRENIPIAGIKSDEASRPIARRSEMED